MKNVLKLKKRGMKFPKTDKLALESNCKYYRLRAENILTKKGILLETIDFRGGLRFEWNFKNGKPRKKPKLIKKLHLFVETSYKTITDNGEEIYKRFEKIENEAREKFYLYTLEDIIKCVNTVAKVPYTDIEII